MVIKRVGSAKSFQQRSAIQRILNIRGLGIVRRSDSQNTLRQIIRRLEQRQANDLARTMALQPTITPAQVEQIDAYNRLIAGTGTYNDFTKTDEYAQIITKYGGNIGQDVAQIYFYDYELSKPGLAQKKQKDLLYKRAVILQTVSKKLKLQQREQDFGKNFLSGPGINTMITKKTGEKITLYSSQKGQKGFITLPNQKTFSTSQMLAIKSAQTNPRLANALRRNPDLINLFK